jgi:hypothetical protein
MATKVTYLGSFIGEVDVIESKNRASDEEDTESKHDCQCGPISVREIPTYHATNHLKDSGSL